MCIYIYCIVYSVYILYIHICCYGRHPGPRGAAGSKQNDNDNDKNNKNNNDSSSNNDNNNNSHGKNNDNNNNGNHHHSNINNNNNNNNNRSSNIYIYIYICSDPGPQGRSGLSAVRPISLLRLSLPRFVDSNFPGNSLWAWEFHSSNLRFCLSSTL